MRWLLNDLDVNRNAVDDDSSVAAHASLYLVLLCHDAAVIVSITIVITVNNVLIMKVVDVVNGCHCGV